MATNILVFGASPRWPIDSPTAAHVSGEVAFENGKIGVMTETNVTSGGVNGNTPLQNTRNTLLERAIVMLPMPSAVAAGTKVYFLTASLTAGATVQLPPSRSTNVASTLQTSATSATLIGVTRDLAAPYGATAFAAPVELAPYPTT